MTPYKWLKKLGACPDATTWIKRDYPRAGFQKLWRKAKQHSQMIWLLSRLHSEDFITFDQYLTLDAAAEDEHWEAKMSGRSQRTASRRAANKIRELMPRLPKSFVRMVKNAKA
jgi:hypothetical protein